MRILLPLAAFPLIACVASADESTGSTSAEISGAPDAINIGFNGDASQFPFLDDFFAKSDVPRPGPRLCHTYPGWNVAEQPAGSGSLSDSTSRAWLEAWLRAAEGHCDEALLSFKPPPGTAAPSTSAFAAAFAKFRATSWAGWTGRISFTPWNEPNNGAGGGDGLGAPLSPEQAAAYYLAIRHACVAPDCKVAAGDLASNGEMYKDFRWSCPDDDVAPSKLCHAASYLDRYKNYIANHANDAPYHLGPRFRPEYFAYHGWYDVNSYLDTGSHCSTVDDCTTRALLQNVGGSWGGAKIWDTEVGSGQDGTGFPDPADAPQACGTAFLLRLSADLSARIERVYYTRLYGGNGRLVDVTSGTTTYRPAFVVLADHHTSYTPKAGEAACK
jgi:hypothetical protein